MRVTNRDSTLCCLLLAVWFSGCGAGVPEAAPQPPARLTVAGILRHDEALGEAHDVELQGDLAFVPGKDGSLAVIDIADPAAPEIVWHRYDPEGLPDSETVLIAGGWLFLGTKDFHSIDIRNPRAPKLEAVVSDRPRIERINGMVRSGDVILAANKEGWIDAFDVSEPRSPRLAGALETRERYGLDYPHDIDLVDGLVVIVDPNQFGRDGNPGQLAVFRVFDESGELANANDWSLVGSIATTELTGANRVEVSESYAFVGGSLNKDVSNGVPGARGVVVDLSDPTQPRQAAAVSFSDVRGPNGLAIGGKVWFLAGGQTIEAYDITDPEAPRQLAVFRSPEAFPTADDNAHDLVYRDGYLYVSSQGDNGFVILKVEDPEILDLARR